MQRAVGEQVCCLLEVKSDPYHSDSGEKTQKVDTKASLLLKA